jgi:tRNA(fMet)-specific endonuclease VapC
MIEPRPLLSVVVAGELRSLAYQFQWGKAKLDKASFLLNYFQRISIDDPDIIEAYAVLDAYSESVGRKMGKNDLWIAATAKVMVATILTTDKDFDHLSPDFVTRIWVDPDFRSQRESTRGRCNPIGEQVRQPSQNSPCGEKGQKDVSNGCVAAPRAPRQSDQPTHQHKTCRGFVSHSKNLLQSQNSLTPRRKDAKKAILQGDTLPFCTLFLASLRLGVRL